MVSDASLKQRLRQILDVADLEVTTEKSIRLQLEKEFRTDLTERKKFIRQEIQGFLSQKQEAEAADDGEITEEGAKPTKKRKKSQAKKDDGAEHKPRGGGGLMKVCAVSDELAALLGAREMPRTEVVKGIWKYIREHNLQDPSNKRLIKCDAALAHLLKTDATDMFQLNKLLTVHIKSLPSEDGKEPVPKKPKVEGQPGVKGGGFSQPLPISHALRSFLGCEEAGLPRCEVVKRMWAYIKEKNLQDPSYKRRILCDKSLQELFGVESFEGFVMTKLLSAHLGKGMPVPVHNGVEHSGSDDDLGSDHKE